MRQSVKAVIWAAAMILVLAGATIGYRILKADYDLNRTSSLTSSSESETAPAADFTVYDADGSEVKLSSKFGKPIVLNFWATWCGPCRAELPDFNKVHAELGGEVQFFMVNVDGPGTEADVKTFLSDNGYTFPVYYDAKYNGAYAYGVSSIPVSYFISAQGQIVMAQYGAISEQTLRDNIDEIMNKL